MLISYEFQKLEKQLFKLSCFQCTRNILLESKVINMKYFIYNNERRDCDITKQLVHSFAVNIRISQPMKSDVNLGFASVNITILGVTNPDVYLKIMPQMYNVSSEP